ncbi:protein of unknown function [Streptomyces murinus]
MARLPRFRRATVRVFGAPPH